MTMYDDGETFTAGDEFAVHFDNDRLIELIEAVNAILPDPATRRMIRLAILRAIFGAAVDR